MKNLIIAQKDIQTQIKYKFLGSSNQDIKGGKTSKSPSNFALVAFSPKQQ
jgi:hypothetical protein